jgi:hypothetical protein
MTALQNGLRRPFVVGEQSFNFPSTPVTPEEFLGLDTSTRLLIEAGVFDASWPEARAAYLQATAQQCCEGIMAMHITGDAKYLIVH